MSESDLKKILESEAQARQILHDALAEADKIKQLAMKAHQDKIDAVKKELEAMRQQRRDAIASRAEQSREQLLSQARQDILDWESRYKKKKAEIADFLRQFVSDAFKKAR